MPTSILDSVFEKRQKFWLKSFQIIAEIGKAVAHLRHITQRIKLTVETSRSKVQTGQV